MDDYAIITTEKINDVTKDSVTNLTLQTIAQGKQVLIFNNSKRNSEAAAERVADAIKNFDKKEELKELSNKILKSLANPTKQCRRLAKIVEKGAAFHHSGLISKQRTLIEDNFKNGLIKVISSTPTLASGLNLPAYKVIIKDYKRYSSRGLIDIPILEYHQMTGRAGRPGLEKEGRAVLCLNREEEIPKIVPKYVFGKPEEIVSKLAVEPTLKMYILSLLAMDMINSKKEIKEFFSNTFYATQFGDMDALSFNIFRILDILREYGFVAEMDDDYYVATQLGKKVSELYLNPDTANYFIVNFDKIVKRFSSNSISKKDVYSLIQFICMAAEMRPLFRVGKAEEELYVRQIEDIGDDLIVEFNPFEDDYELLLNSIKTSNLFSDWINESHEDFISDKYKVTPGELNYKLDIFDWLLYSLEEISILKKSLFMKNTLKKLRTRFKNGIKEELLPLISIRGIGRVRARKLFEKNLKTISDLKSVSFETLSNAIGSSIAIKIKKELKVSIDERPDVSRKDIPREIKVREVSTEEVEVLVNDYKKTEEEKEERQKSLTSFF